MSATATTEKPKSRAELLSAALQRRHDERAKLEQRISELPALEKEARLEALAQRPTQRSDALGSQAQKLRDERLKKTADLDRLNADVSALEKACAAAKLEDLASQFEATEAEAEAPAKTETALWRQAGDQFAALAATYAQLRDECWEPRELGREELRHGEFASLLNSPEVGEAFSGVWSARVRPLPTTFAGFLAYLSEASLDPRSAGYRSEGGRRLDAEDPVTSLVPDLRG